MAVAGLPVSDAVRHGSFERLAPVLMTALTAGLALIPLVLRGGEPGNEVQSPMAQVILGGLLTSTFLNLVVVPALYERWGGSSARPPATDAPAIHSSPVSRAAPTPPSPVATPRASPR
jgi:Cu/Ag efflux pump CusA